MIAWKEALEKISRLRPVGDVNTCKNPRGLVEQMETIAFAALTQRPPEQAGAVPAEPVAWCSPGQLANLMDVDVDGGVYLPIRKSERGNFTMPLYAAPTPPDAGIGSDGAGDGTALGEVQCHCSEDDGVPDVGVSVGLGSGRALWIGELLTADGATCGMVFHGPDRQRIVAPFAADTDWQEAADILRHHVGPALATQPGDGGRA